MKKQYLKNFLIFCFFSCLAIVQIFLSGSFNPLLFHLSLMMAIIVLLIVLFDLKLTMFFIAVAGTIIDLYSNLPFGFHLIVFFISALLLNLLFYNFFTNRHLYSLIFLGLIGVAIYNLILAMLAELIYLFGWNDFTPNAKLWTNVAWQMLFMIMLMTFLYFIINKITRRFRPVFLQN